MNLVRIGGFWLLLGIPLLIFYLFQNAADIGTIRDVRNDVNKTKPPAKHKPYVYPFATCQQNVSAANITGFSSLPGRVQDFFYYQHCRHFPMLLDSPDKCGGAEKSAEVFLLLIIKSSPGNYDRRAVVRNTWAKERLYKGGWIRRIFISGTTGSGFKKKRLDKLLELEQREHNDILQWDFTDTFYNLTLKQILFLEWMERNCPNVRFLLNGDDDIYASTDNMVNFLKSLKDNDGSKHLFVGHLNVGMGVVRDSWSKYFVPYQLQESEFFPPYCSGGGFFLSGYTAMVIYNMSQSIPFIPIDDAYMGICLAKAGLSPAHHVGVRPLGLKIPSKTADKYDPCYYKDILVAHRFLPAHLYLMWHRIHDPNLKCGMNFG